MRGPTVRLRHRISGSYGPGALFSRRPRVPTETGAGRRRGYLWTQWASIPRKVGGPVGRALLGEGSQFLHLCQFRTGHKLAARVGARRRLHNQRLHTGRVHQASTFRIPSILGAQSIVDGQCVQATSYSVQRRHHSGRISCFAPGDVTTTGRTMGRTTLVVRAWRKKITVEMTMTVPGQEQQPVTVSNNPLLQAGRASTSPLNKPFARPCRPDQPAVSPA